MFQQIQKNKQYNNSFNYNELQNLKLKIKIHSNRTNQDTDPHNWDEHIKNATILKLYNRQVLAYNRVDAFKVNLITLANEGLQQDWR